MDKAELKQLLKELQDPAKVNDVPSIHASTDVVELARPLEECPNGRITVEEQHHSNCIIHLSNEPNPIWFAVTPGSDLCRTPRTPQTMNPRALGLEWLDRFL